MLSAKIGSGGRFHQLGDNNFSRNPADNRGFTVIAAVRSTPCTYCWYRSPGRSMSEAPPTNFSPRQVTPTEAAPAAFRTRAATVDTVRVTSLGQRGARM